MGRVLMDATGLHRTVIRLSHEIGERNKGYADIVLIGAGRCGEIVAERIGKYILNNEGFRLPCGRLKLRTSSSLKYDFMKTGETAAEDTADGEESGLGFSIDGKTVILCDDVIHTGRNVVASVEALFRIGQPRKIQLLVLVDRGGRELPVRADFVGKNVPTSRAEYIDVCFEELGKQDCFSIIGGKK